MVTALALLGQLLVPLALIYWVSRGSGWIVLLKAITAALWLVLIAMIGVWASLPSWLIWIYAGAIGVAAAVAIRSERRPLAPRTLAFHVLIIVVLISVTVYLAWTRRPLDAPGDPHSAIFEQKDARLQ